jgi:predicted protein tyrosine phosphatase
MKIRVSNIQRALDVFNDFGAQKVISLVNNRDIIPHFGLDDNHHLIVPIDDVSGFSDPFCATMGDIDRILDFVRWSLNSNTLVHCEGGISRSTAVAISLLVWDGMSVDDAVDMVHRDSPNISPNVLILRLFDAKFQEGGKFIHSVLKKVASLDKGLMLWCNDCQEHFLDGTNCKGGHWL